MDNEIIVLLIALLFISIGNIFRKNPPPYPSSKQREFLNFGFKLYVSGYMSKRALKNENTWKYANSTFGKNLIITGATEFLVIIIFLCMTYIFSQINIPKLEIESAVLIVGFIVSILHTEIKLSGLKE